MLCVLSTFPGFIKQKGADLQYLYVYEPGIILLLWPYYCRAIARQFHL